MKVEKTADGKFAIVQGSNKVVLEKSQYEDIFYALPLDVGQLFRLINDTILSGDARASFRSLVAEAGGSEKAMTELQASAQALEPA